MNVFFIVGFFRYSLGVLSRVHRMKVSDRMFFVSVNLRRSVARFTEAEYALILGSLDESRRRLGFALCGYVLMPDHGHALLWPQAPLTISRVLHDGKLFSARHVNALRERQGPLWQHPFRDRFVRHKREYSERLNYRHDNPVRKGLVAKPEDWRWSSFRNFSLNEAVRAACPIQIDSVELPESYRG